jgi:PPE-repeat protein
VLALPAKDNSNNPINYYFRAYSQYMGSDPQKKHIYYGTTYAPTAVTLSGASKLTLLQSQGSGTGRSDGTQGGAGLGFVQKRAAVTAKRAPAPQVK